MTRKKDRPETKRPDKVLPAKSLSLVLGESEHVKNLVEESARELSSVNTVLKEEVAAQNEVSGIDNLLEKSEAIEKKVLDAAEKLSVVNEALEAELETRNRLEQRLVTLTQEEETARHLAFHDPLTGLPNRALFDSRLEHGLAQASRHGWNLAVMFMDLDDFKKINDVHGHDIGDAVLKTVAERLKRMTREEDTVSRHGGDEFLYLLMEVGDAHDIAAIAEKIVNAIQSPCKLSVGELVIKPSIGIAIFPQDGVAGLELLKSADRAMYEAKRKRLGYAFTR